MAPSISEGDKHSKSGVIGTEDEDDDDESLTEATSWIDSMPGSGGSLELKLYRQQSSFRFTECQAWLFRAWGAHFVACILVLAYGAWANHTNA